MSTESPSATSSLSARASVAVLVGVLAALWVRTRAASAPSFSSDFDQLWAAARALLAGENPYSAVGPVAAFKWKWPLYYPLPAVLVASPLGTLDVVAARMLFAGIGAATFAFAVTRDAWSRWPIFLSVTFYVSVDLVQWSPFLAAAFFVPALAVLTPCKPNFAIPLSAGSRDVATWRSLAIGFVVLGAVSFLVRPTWFGEWVDNVRGAPHFIPPIARHGGFLVLLAALRWRRSEARWLLALAMIPQAPSFYDQLLLVAVCTTWWETAILSLGTYVLFFYVGAHSPQPDYLSWGRLVGNATVWFCYLPMVAILLRRPNEGRLPDIRKFLTARSRLHARAGAPESSHE